MATPRFLPTKPASSRCRTAKSRKSGTPFTLATRQVETEDDEFIGYYQDGGETTRMLLPMMTALADMYEKAAELRGMFAYLAKEHGIRLPYPPVRDRA